MSSSSLSSSSSSSLASSASSTINWIEPVQRHDSNNGDIALYSNVRVDSKWNQSIAIFCHINASPPDSHRRRLHRHHHHRQNLSAEILKLSPSSTVSPTAVSSVCRLPDDGDEVNSIIKIKFVWTASSQYSHTSGIHQPIIYIRAKNCCHWQCRV